MTQGKMLAEEKIFVGGMFIVYYLYTMLIDAGDILVFKDSSTQFSVLFLLQLLQIKQKGLAL